MRQQGPLRYKAHGVVHAQAGGATHGNAQLQGTGLWVTGSGGQLAQQLQAGAIGQGKGLEAFGWL